MNVKYKVLCKIALMIFIAVIANISFCLAQDNERTEVDSLSVRIDSLLKKKDVKALKQDFLNLLEIYEYSGKWDDYDKLIGKMQEYADKINNDELKAEIYNELGASSCLRGKNIEAIKNISKALEYNLSINDSASVSNSYENLGVVYKDLAEYDKAIRYQIQSLKIREKINHPRLPNNYTNLATIYSLLNDTLNQFKYLNRAKKAIQEKKDVDFSQMAIIHNEIAGYYNRMNNTDSMIFHYQKVADYSEKIGWKRGMAVGYGNLAEVYYKLEMYDKAIREHNIVLGISTELDDCLGITEEYEYLAIIYEAIGKLDSALILNQKALEKAEECGFGKDMLNILQTALRIYETKGKFSQALEYSKKYQTLNDSLFNKEKQNTIAEIETKYQTEKKEQLIELLTAENQLKNQRIRFGIAIIAALILLITSGVFIMRMRKRNAKMLEDELKQKLFRSQMNPHFIYNALGSIQNYMYKNETKKAAQYLGNFASLSRSILKYSNEETIELEKEIESLNNYIELERMRMKDVFECEIIYDEGLETEFISIPPMMIQPFIENSIKHGFNENGNEGRLRIEFIDKGKYLQVIIEDNGVGLTQSSQHKREGHESMATGIFKQRMKFIKRKFPKLPDLEIQEISENSTTGTKVTLFLPIIEKG